MSASRILVLDWSDFFAKESSRMKPRVHGPTIARAWFGEILTVLDGARRERAAEKQLLSLSNHILSDMGIARAEIPWVVKTLAAGRVD